MVNNLGTFAPLIERRAGSRYPVSLELSYRGLNGKSKLTGHGKTINISSSGILFATEQPLLINADVELMLRWPVLLNNEVPLQLKVSGRVRRTDGSRAAIEISQYEFRISGRGVKAANPPVQADATA